MDVFDLRNRLVSDYRDYTRSFIRIRDPRIKGFVDDVLDKEGFWPEPLLQLNPTFRPGGTIDDLVAEGVLHEECSRIFRVDKSDTDHRGRPLLLHRHQREAILQATAGRSCVLTTGTGSGKSLAYIVPIVDHVLRNGSGRGIRAIVVYPMNALANSQDEELGKFLCKGYPEGRAPVRFARYTGQERGAVPRGHTRRSPGHPPDELHAADAQDRATTLLPREDRREADDDGGHDAYLYLSEEAPWPRAAGSTLLDRLPDALKETTAQGLERVRPNARNDVPQPVFVDSTGRLVPEGAGTPAALIHGNFLFCLEPSCGVAYTRSQRSERFKLATLGVDNRSTATTILAVRSLIELQHNRNLAPEARKLLSFTDNRQDASLQAGHFNDFVQVALLRSALYRACEGRRPVRSPGETAAQNRGPPRPTPRTGGERGVCSGRGGGRMRCAGCRATARIAPSTAPACSKKAGFRPK